MKRSRRDIAALYHLGFSLSGLGLLAILALSGPVSEAIFPWQKQLTLSIFSLICILGIFAGLSPSKCSRILHFRRRQRKPPKSTSQTSTEETATTFKGHHPTCGKFSSHIIAMGRKIYCAGCAGLVAGGVMSLAGTLLYLIFEFDGGEASALVFWLGVVGVVCGLLQYNLSAGRGDVHFLLNVAFVFGAFLLLVGVNELKGNLVLNLYFLALVVYWIATRIVLSQFEHRRICAACGLESCSLSFD